MMAAMGTSRLYVRHKANHCHVQSVTGTCGASGTLSRNGSDLQVPATHRVLLLSQIPSAPILVTPPSTSSQLSPLPPEPHQEESKNEIEFYMKRRQMHRS